jgi:MOSC domain-containing protein YiiM
MKYQVLQLFTGKIQPFIRPNFQSAIVKDEVTEPIAITHAAFGDDEVANKKHHGGPQRVIHQYAAEHYTFWSERFPESAEHFIPSSYGENLSTLGMTEENVHIGDIYRLGSALVQVSEPRRPCGTLNLRYRENSYLKELEKTNKFGWMYRVLEEGKVQKGDHIELVERVLEELPVSRVIRAIFDTETDQSLLSILENCSELSRTWRDYSQQKNS